MNTLTVYLGSGGKARDIFKTQATRLGELIAQQNKQLVYGGMNAGLMGALAQSALKNGAAVTGILPRKLQDSERILEGLTRTLLVEELCDRKRLMFEEGDAIVVLPGGFGTADEMLEALYWGSLKLHSKPVVLVNIEGYWNDLIEFLETLPDFDPAYLIIVDEVDQVLSALAEWATLPPRETPAHMPHFEDEISRGTDQPIIIDRATLENAYFVVCALGLKQLDKHQRKIGFLNPDGVFNSLFDWTESAHREHFITDHCLQLFDSGTDFNDLLQKLEKQNIISIDLHRDKWDS